jgi:hypothetical protein
MTCLDPQLAPFIALGFPASICAMIWILQR